MFGQQKVCHPKSTDLGARRPRDESQRLCWGADQQGDAGQDSAPS